MIELQTAGVNENWNWLPVVRMACGLTAKLLGPAKLSAKFWTAGLQSTYLVPLREWRRIGSDTDSCMSAD